MLLSFFLLLSPLLSSLSPCSLRHPGNLCVDTSGNLVYYDFGMMDELTPNVKEGFRKFCTALFAGGPVVNDRDLAKNAKMLVEGVEQAGVLSGSADRLAVAKLAQYYMRTFKNKQLGKKSGGIKETVGTDLQTLTENNVFRFPPTFTFIFRSFASIDGIGKGLSPTFDVGKLAQPFIEVFTEGQKGNKTDFEKNLGIFGKATGLNIKDVNTAITSPRRIEYIEETLRSMEAGTLKVRVRSLENEKALERMAITQGNAMSLLLCSVALNLVSICVNPYAKILVGAGAANFAFKAYSGNKKIKSFDKKQLKFTTNKFTEEKKGDGGEDDEK